MATIKLTITVMPSVTPAGVRVQLDVRNEGDVPARNVMPILAFRGNETLGTFEPMLEPGRAISQTITIPRESAGTVRGTWPLYCRVAYADANNHPFEALHVMSVGSGSSGVTTSPVTLDVTGARLAVAGQAQVRLRSTIGTDAAVSFVVPAGVAVTPEHSSVYLEPGTRTIAAVVTNAGATASSRLPMFVVAEFNAGGEHATAIGAGTLDIVADDGLPTWVLPVALVALVALWIAVVAIRRRSTSQMQ